MAARPAFKKTVFDNGLTLLTERLSDYRSLSIGVWVKTGARHESPSEAGLSHYLEHMLFKGTASRTALEIARAVDRVGGEFNAFTAREYTCFHILLLDRDVDLGLDILSDVMLNSDFNAEEFERERKVILQEIAMVDESPEELAYDLFFDRIFPRHGLGRPILGSETGIKRMKRGDMLRFFRKHYRPDQVILSVAGDVSHDYVKKKIGGLIRAAWPGRPAAGRAARPDRGGEPAPKIKPGCWWAVRPTEQVHLIWGIEGLPYASKDRFAALLLNIYLGGGMSSSLFQEIREKKGLAYTVYSSLSPYSDSGVFTVYAATGMNQVALCLRLIEECVEQVRKDLLPDDEIQMIKDNLKGTVLLSSDNVESRMSAIAKAEIFLGEYHDPEKICAQIDAVTAADIRRVARKLFAQDGRSVLLLGPKPSRQLRSKLAPVMI